MMEKNCGCVPREEILLKKGLQVNAFGWQSRVEVGRSKQGLDRYRV